MKTLTIRVVTLVLVLIFAGPIALEAQSNDPPPNDKDSTAIACAVLAIGIVVIYGLWKICNKIPALNPPNNGTNGPPPIIPPPTNNIKTNPPGRHKTSLTPDTFVFQLDLENVSRYSISQYQFADTVTGGEYTTKAKWSVQASTNLNALWLTTLSISVFRNDFSQGQLWAVYRDGTNLYNAYFTPGADFNLPVDFALPNEPQQFFRLNGLVWADPLESF